MFVNHYKIDVYKFQLKQYFNIKSNKNLNRDNMAMVRKSRNSEEQKWQAESDAQTMATYQEIMQDKTRMSRAIKVAKSKAADLSKRASAMQNVARTRSMTKRK